MKSLLIATAICASFMLPGNSQALEINGKTYKTYKPNWQPMKETPSNFVKWQALTKQGKDEGNTRELLEKKIKIIKPLVKKNPKWVDGYWIYANTLMAVGETLSADDKDSAKMARKYLIQSRKNSKKCLDLDKDNAICKFFYAASIGKIGTIDGIMSSLGKGETVLNTWLEVYNSDTEYVFAEGYSLQGLVRYALGIFYRVVPDFFLLRWIFNISGDIDKAIQMHQESLAFAGSNGPCSNMMLAVSLLCKTGGDEGKQTSQAISILDRLANAPKTDDASAMVCINDAPKVKAKPENACGYTKAQVQKRDEESLKKEHEGKS